MSTQVAPVWFITGCSSGFGRALVEAVLSRGWQAVVTARNASDLDYIAPEHRDRALIAELDVTDRDRIAEVTRLAEEKFGGLDVLVNNAGFGYLSSVEEGEEKEVRAIFETNFFACLWMAQAVLPGMRARRTGCIVQMSSIGGVVSKAGTGYYHASKFALEGLSGAMSDELAPLGIRVLVVEPGPFRTAWAGRSLRTGEERIVDYRETAGASRQVTLSADGRQPGDPAQAAEAIISAVESPSAPLHLVLGRQALDLATQNLGQLAQDYDKSERICEQFGILP